MDSIDHVIHCIVHGFSNKTKLYTPTPCQILDPPMLSVKYNREPTSYSMFILTIFILVQQLSQKSLTLTAQIAQIELWGKINMNTNMVQIHANPPRLSHFWSGGLELQFPGNY